LPANVDKAVVAVAFGDLVIDKLLHHHSFGSLAVVEVLLLLLEIRIEYLLKLATDPFVRRQ
jgi:hypothetical protein